MVSTEEALANSAFVFPKLAGPENYIQWSRQMLHEIKSAELYGLIDDKQPWDPPEEYSPEEFEELSKKDRAEHRDDVRKYHTKVASLAGKISKMCEQHIQQLIDIDWTAKEVWTYLKEQYSPKGWSNKWDVLNRLMSTTMAECKKVSVYGDQMQRILKEVKDLDMTLAEAVVIITLNNLGPGFETYLAIVNDKARTEKKLPELGSLIKALQEEESRLNTAEIHFNRASARGSERGGRGSYRGNDRGSGRGGRGGGRSDNRSGDSNTNSTPKLHQACGKSHPPGPENCPDKDAVCTNRECKRKGHRYPNCTWPGGPKYDDWKKKKEEKDRQRREGNNSASSPTTHVGHIYVGMVHINAVGLALHEVYTSHLQEEVWIMDSGATHHCSGNRSLFPSMKKVNDRANTASGEVLAVEGIGSVVLPMPNRDSIELSDVMFIPNLTVNLISIEATSEEMDYYLPRRQTSMSLCSKR